MRAVKRPPALIQGSSASSCRLDDLDYLRSHEHAVPLLAGLFTKDAFTDQLFYVQLSRALSHFHTLRRLTDGNGGIGKQFID